jgi:tRNA threonylcarbamoyl adenosine modification protein (Sua5/YciO/YrdC/YwlC family)
LKLIKNPSPKLLEDAVEKHWKPDSTVLHFTGNMFGIGCRLSSSAGIDKISKLKQRPEKNGYIVLLSDLQWLFDNDIAVPVGLLPILKQYWQGNLTVVFSVRDSRFASVALNGKVAFRVPSDNMLRHIIDILDEPIISSSINISGIPPAETLEDITTRYDAWFDLGFVPNDTETIEPSTIIEYIDTNEHGKPVLPYLRCLRESSIPFYEIKQTFNAPSLLFVCMGNICRSPIAEYLFNHYSQQKNLPFSSTSAGLLDTGSMISVNSMQLLAEQGIMAQEHYSRKINPEILNGSWLILTMEERQRDYIRNNFPESAHKVFTLKEYVGEEGDIADPVGYDIDYYRDIYQQIDIALIKLFDLISPAKL